MAIGTGDNARGPIVTPAQSQPRLRGWLGGVIAAGLALGITELAAGLLGSMPSLIESVAALVVPRLPGDLVTWGIETFGQSDRAVLAIVITLVVLAIGARAGIMQMRGHTDRARLLFFLFALIGVLATTGAVATSLPVVVVVTAIATWLGVVAMAWLIDLRGSAVPTAPPDAGDAPTDRPGPEPGADHLHVARSDGREPLALDRRRFLAAATTLGGVAVATAATGRWLARMPVASTAMPTEAPPLTAAQPLPPPPAAATLDVEGLTPLFVPNDDFYRIDTALTGPPRVSLDDWRLRIHGMVDNPMELDFADLIDSGLVETDVTIACVSNEVGGHLVGNARWTGVPLAPLLERAGVQDGATQLVGRAVDGFTVGFPSQLVFDGRDAMVAVAMNGEPLPIEHGFPARLIVPGLYGYVSATKWLSDIELTQWDDFDAFWIVRGWAKEGPVKVQSRIDVARAEATGDRLAIAGVAWAPPVGIKMVEVRVDDGPWQQATLSQPIDDDVWVQWQLRVELPEGSHRATVRATDGTGFTQPEEPVPPHPDGAEGWHSILFAVD